MAATARSPKPRPRPKALPPAPLPEPDDDGDVIDLGDGEGEAEPERVPLFRIGETVYTMLKDPPLSLALKALDMQSRRVSESEEDRADAQGVANAYVMREMLGEQAYRALLSSRTLTASQWAAITGRVTRRVLGALERDDSPNS